MFLAENVKGLVTMGNGEVIKQIVAEFAEKGYHVEYRLYNAKQFGVPQDRERVILVGTREDLPLSFQFPEPTHGPGTGQRYVTMRDAIWDMQDDPGEWSTAAFSSRYMSRRRKRGWDEVSYCIQAMAKQNSMHPSGDPMRKLGQDDWVFDGPTNRRLSAEECKVIQSFPKSFQLTGTLEEKYRQVGNAVPPLLAQAVASKMLESLHSLQVIVPISRAVQAKILTYVSK
jgi:DNA (cytosine-5)-methyltransferase 1